MKFGLVLLLLTSISAIAADGQKNGVSVLTTDCVLAQVADGGGWGTRITLVNMDTVVASYRLWFRDDTGKSWPVSLNGGQASNVWAGTIPVGGSVFLETPDTAHDTSQGWAYLETGQRVSGMGVFKADLGSHDAQAVVPLSNLLDSDFYMPFDNRVGYVTSIALVNGDASQNAGVTLTFRNPDGTTLLVDRITLNPLQHMAFATAQKYPSVDTKNGVIEFTVNGHGASALGLLFTNHQSFTSVHALSN